MSSPRRGLSTSTSSADRENALCKNMIAVWDNSRKPTDNSDRQKKIGSGDQTNGAAICGFDQVTLAAKIANGWQAGRYATKRPFEPDNWWLDVHEKQGKGRDVMWALRVIDDHDNGHNTKECRATKVVNQCKTQEQGVISDILWGIDVGTKNDDEEMRMTAAGYLAGLCDKPGSVASKGGNNPRAAIAFNIAKNQGRTTDGKSWGMFHQILTHWPGTKPDKKTVTKKGKQECVPPVKQQLCIAGDAPFHMFDTRCHIAIEDVIPQEYDVIVTGANFRGIIAPAPPDKELQSDSASNHGTKARDWDRGIRPWVKIPRPDVPTYNSYPGVPTDFPDRPTTVVSPTTVDVGAVPEVSDFDASGEFEAQSGTIVVPRTLIDPNGLTVSVNYITPLTDFLGAVEGRFDYCVIPLGGSVRPVALTGSIPYSLAAGLGGGVEAEMLFNIPYAQLAAAGGGKVVFAFYRAGDDDQLDSLYVVCKTTSYGPPIV